MKTLLNILPPEKKRELRLMRRYRHILRQGWGILFLVFFLAGLLFGVWFLLKLEEQSAFQKSEAKKAQDESYARVALYEKTFAHVQNTMPFVERVLSGQKGAVWIFQILGEVVPKETALSSVFIDENVLKLNGHSDTRDHLLVLQERLRGASCFTDVSLPWSQIAQKEDIDFEITVTLDPKCFLKK